MAMQVTCPQCRTAFTAKAALAVKGPRLVNALDFSAPDEQPASPRRRPRWGGLIALAPALFFLPALGGGAAAVGAPAYLAKSPIHAAAPPAPDPASPAAGLTAEKFDKIDKGMTLEAVKELLGPESRTAPVPGHPREHNHIFRDGDVVITVTGREGKVVAKENNQGWAVTYPGDVAAKPPEKNPPDNSPPPDKPAGAVTRENFDKIDKGMSLDQVKALLGPGFTDKTTPGDPLVKRYAWKDGDSLVVVALGADKVFEKTSLGKGERWPTVWPGDAGKPPPPPPDKPAGAVTKENFDKIDKGMSVDEVIALLGKPTNSEVPLAKAADKDNELAWFSGDHQTVLTSVKFRKGKVVEKFHGGWATVYPSVGVEKGTGRLTQENFDKIDRDMSMDDVKALLGPPATAFQIPGVPTFDAGARWVDADKSWIDVTSFHGKVFRKSTSHNWAVTYPKDDK